MKMLIVEDDMTLAKELVLLCERWGFEAVYAKQFDDITNEYISRQPDLILMDINLPSFDGFYWCEKIRQISNVPLLYLSSRDQNADKVMAMAAGGDDYVEKPYDIDILLAKIKGIFKRRYSSENLVDGNISIDKTAHKIYLDGNEVAVTVKEYELLVYLMENKGKVIKKEELFNAIWGFDSESEPQTLTVHIKFLREKFEEDPKNPKRILTVWGVGYRFE